MSMLHEAAKSGNVERFQTLLARDKDIDLVDNEGFTPLFWACFSGKIKMVNYLIRKGCDPNYTKNRLRPIHGAAINGYKEVLKILLKNGVDVDSREFCSDRTPLHWAAQEGRIDAGRYLIEQGANINKLNKSGETPLRIAIGEDNIDFVKTLCKFHVDINKYATRASALILACAYNRIEIVRFLIERGANINIRNEDNETPLFFAARHGSKELVNLLISNHADLRVKNKNGKRAVDFAKNKMIRSLLIA